MNKYLYKNIFVNKYLRCDKIYEINFYDEIFTCKNEIQRTTNIPNHAIKEQIKFIFFNETSKIVIDTNMQSKNYSNLFKIMIHDFFVMYYNEKNQNSFVEIAWDDDYNKMYNTHKIIINNAYVKKRLELLNELCNSFKYGEIENGKNLYINDNVLWSLDDYVMFVKFIGEPMIMWFNKKYNMSQKHTKDYCGLTELMIENTFMKKRYFYR